MISPTKKKIRTNILQMNNLQVTTKTVTAKEFKAHRPQATEFKKLLEMWAKDFEKMEAASELSANSCSRRHIRGRGTTTS